MMNMSEKKLWTDEQFMKYFVNDDVPPHDIQTWRCEQLIFYIYDKLMESSSAIADYLAILCHERGAGFMDEKDNERLFRLQTAGANVVIFIELLRRWLFLKKVILSEGIPQIDERFMSDFIEKNRPLHTLISHSENILIWTHVQFVQYVYNGLNQELSAIAKLLDDLITDVMENCYLHEQKRLLTYFKSEVTTIQKEIETLKIWLSKEE